MKIDRRLVQLLLLAVAIAAAAGAAALVLAGSWATAAMTFAISVLVVVNVPSERSIPYSLSLAAAIAAPLVLLNDVNVAGHSHAAVALILGILGAHAYRAVAAPLPSGYGFAVVCSLVSVMVFLWGFGYVLESTANSLNRVDGLTVSISAAVFLWFVVDVMLGALVRRVSAGQLFTNGVAVALLGWQAAASILATGVLFGIAWRFTEWWWALAVSLLPYGFAHIAFRRADVTRKTYRQTIRALSRIPEVSGLSPDGHGDRTARLALDVASELYLSPSELQDLEFAAQMHDIGRITLNQPSILRMGFTDDDIARWGSEMVDDVPYLKKVSALVLAQHEPYRCPGEQKDPDLAMGSKIIKAASAYDHATSELGFTPVEALEVLHRGAAYDYDPEVVGAIRTVLEREGVF